ncbi:MAG TPA: OmpA family protein [Casimicrobiaceae bacterium]|nr:OmpA family protein [Casimicrobiaceae bacterium]
MKLRYLCIAGSAVALLAACATLPPPDEQVERARSSVSAVETDPQVARYAPLELSRTETAWQRAETAWRHGDDRDQVHHLAYLTIRQADFARETARQRAAEAAISNADAERERVQLQARTREAEAARLQAEAAQQAAIEHQRDADAARVAAERQRARAEDARTQASIAAERADLSRRHAAAAEQEASIAREQAAAASSQLSQVQQQASQLAEEVRGLKAQRTDHGTIVTLGDVLFDVDRATLNPGGERAVHELAAMLAAHPEQRITISGFTDNTGSDSYNQTLSENRASSVRGVLVASGIAPDRILTRGYGKSYPVATNRTEAGRQLNRRVEVAIADSSTNVSSTAPIGTAVPAEAAIASPSAAMPAPPSTLATPTR